MDFMIRKAVMEDLPGLVRIMEEATRSIEEPSWFVSYNEAFMASHLQGGGFALAAQAADGTLAGLFLVDIPGLSPDNLGRDAGLSEGELLKAAHMDSAAVLPAYRGHKLQARLMAAAETDLAARGYRHLLCTIHPDNRYSLSNALERGYAIAATLKKYGGLDRHVLYKSNGPAIAALRYPDLDDFLLSLPGAQKDFKVEWQWLRYQVGSKLFAALCTPGLAHGSHAGRTMLILKCDPLLAELYRSQYAEVVPGFYSDKRTWNSVYLDGDLPKELVFAMCTHAYEQTLSKLPKKVQREIRGE